MTDIVHHTLIEARDRALEAVLESGVVAVSATLPETPGAARVQAELRVSGTNAHADSQDLPYTPGPIKIRLARPRGIAGRRLLIRLLACDAQGRILWQVLDHPVSAGPEGPAGLGFIFDPDPYAPPGAAWIADWKERSVVLSGPTADAPLARRMAQEAMVKAWEALLTDIARGDVPERHPLARRIEDLLKAKGLAFDPTRNLARWRRTTVVALLAGANDTEDDQ